MASSSLGASAAAWWVRNRLGHAPQSLVDAVTLMEANIEEPLSTLELAEHLGISRRQLERLFKTYLPAAGTSQTLVVVLHGDLSSGGPADYIFPVARNRQSSGRSASP